MGLYHFVFSELSIPFWVVFPGPGPTLIGAAYVNLLPEPFFKGSFGMYKLTCWHSSGSV